MGNVVLFVDACEEMRVRTNSINAHIIACMGRLDQRNHGRMREVGISEVHVERVCPASLVEMVVKAHAVGIPESEVKHIVFA